MASAAHVADADVHAPVANVATADAQDKTDDKVSADAAVPPRSSRQLSTSAWFVPQVRKRRSISAFFSTVLLAATALTASAGLAVPPVPMSSTGHVEMSCLSGKSLFRSLGSRAAPPDYFKPYIPPGTELRSCIVDSGCSINMFSDKSQFSDLNLGSGHTCKTYVA